MRLMFLFTYAYTYAFKTYVKVYVGRVCWRSLLFVISSYVLNTSLESREHPEYHRLLNSHKTMQHFLLNLKNTLKKIHQRFSVRTEGRRRSCCETRRVPLHSTASTSSVSFTVTLRGKDSLPSKEGKKNSLLSHCLPPVSWSHCWSSSCLFLQQKISNDWGRAEKKEKKDNSRSVT